MSKRDAADKLSEKSAPPAALIEVQVQQAHRNCPLYSWDREAGCLRVTGMQQAERGLPADVATLQLEGQIQLPVLLPAACSFAPGSRLQARLLGALGKPAMMEQALPTDGWVLVAVAEVDSSFTACASL